MSRYLGACDGLTPGDWGSVIGITPHLKKTGRAAVNRVLPFKPAFREAQAMETIELAVERMRRPLKADGTARSAPPLVEAAGGASSQAAARPPQQATASAQVPAPHAFKAQLAEAQLPIKTRVLCEYSPDVQAIVTGQTARPPQAVHVPFAIIASVIAGMVGAVGMAAAMWYSGHSGTASPSTGPASGPSVQSAPALAATSASAPASPPAALRPVAPAAKAETAGQVAAVATPAIAAPASTAPDAAPARELVDAWAKAWSARDVERYLGFYAAGFVPDKGVARTTWEASRRKRLAAQKVIQVAVRDVQVEMQGADRATVRFVQDYSADKYRETGTAKLLVLRRGPEGWRITTEQADTSRLSAS